MKLVNPVHAYLVTSAIAKGRIDRFDLGEAKKVRDVIDIITHENAEKLKEVKSFSAGGYASTTNQPLKSNEIAEEGQIIGIVLANTYEAAREAAHLVKVSYTAATPTTAPCFIATSGSSDPEFNKAVVSSFRTFAIVSSNEKLVATSSPFTIF